MKTAPACEAALLALPERLLVGVSGGLDSTALLHALVQVGRRPVILHFDHGWSAESVAEARRVGTWARALKLPFVTGRARPAARERREAAARTARYAFFARAAARHGVYDLVLAHHADDQVETFLLQLLRGSGSAGRGMDPVTHRDGLTLHRPWLAIPRTDIAAYVRQARLVWRDDPSNGDPRHRRNRIRLRLLPYLRRTFTPAVTANLWRAAEIARAESAWLDTLCAPTAASRELAVRELRAAPLGQQRRTILRWLQSRAVVDVSFADVEAVRGLLDSITPARINLGKSRWARRRAGKIFVEEAE